MSAQNDEADLPIWQREKLFPEKPTDGPYGVQIGRGQARAFETLQDLAAYLADWQKPASLIWTPERQRCFPAEEEAELLASLRRRKAARADSDWSSYRFRAAIFALPLVYFVWKGLAGGAKGLLRSQELGLFSVLWLMFFGLPAYEAWKRRARAIRLRADNLASEAQEIRFDGWIRRQQVPATKILFLILIGVYFAQVLASLEFTRNLFDSVFFPYAEWEGKPTLAGAVAAGLVKNQFGVGYFKGEWWRLFTAPFLHGQVIHIVMNGLGLLFLGRRAETMAGWPHLVMVFVVSMLFGGLASAYGKPSQLSVGASGGIMGVLGFLLAFEFLHARLVPKPATRRLLAAVVFTFIVGFVGYQFIDNWAHGGGLLAGLLYGLIVFPRSSSPHRPGVTSLDKIAGSFSGAVILGAAALAIFLIRTSGAG